MQQQQQLERRSLRWVSVAALGGTRLEPTPAAIPPRQTSGQVRSAAEDEGRRQRLRRIEAKVVAFRESLEDSGVPEAEIEARVASYRSQAEQEETPQESQGGRHRSRSPRSGSRDRDRERSRSRERGRGIRPRSSRSRSPRQ